MDSYAGSGTSALDAKKARQPRPKIVELALSRSWLTVLCLLPFLNKACTTHDPLFLFEGHQILKSPHESRSFAMCWWTEETCIAQPGNLRPPGSQGAVGYVLVPRDFGGRQRVASTSNSNRYRVLGSKHDGEVRATAGFQQRAGNVRCRASGFNSAAAEYS
jgi:hypothetical protein